MTLQNRNLAKQEVVKAIDKYLFFHGWKHNIDSPDFSAMFHWIDPVTGLSHRSDFAYIVQSERDIYEYNK